MQSDETYVHCCKRLRTREEVVESFALVEMFQHVLVDGGPLVQYAELILEAYSQWVVGLQ